MTTAMRVIDEKWAVARVLEEYRRYRVHGRKRPIEASRDVAADNARYLANVIVDEKPNLDMAKIRYRAARALHAEICGRMALDDDDRDFHELTRTEQFWNTGQVTS